MTTRSYPDPDSGDEGKLLAALKEVHKDGEKGAILLSLFICLQYGHPVPAWLAKAFVDAYSRLLNHEGRLGDIFGDHPKGTQFDAVRRRLQLRAKVYDLVNKIREERRRSGRRKYDDNAFTAAGKKLSPRISGKQAEKLYYQEKRLRQFSYKVCPNL
jgi:hypothetical protein